MVQEFSMISYYKDRGRFRVYLDKIKNFDFVALPYVLFI